MPAAARKATARERETVKEEPTSRLMRVPNETYELIDKWAKKQKRYMNQQLAVIVEEWDAMQRARARGK